MPAIGTVSGAMRSVSSGSADAKAKIAMLQNKMQKVMEEVRELGENEDLDPALKNKLMEAKSAMIQAYQAQISAIMNQEAQKATAEAREAMSAQVGVAAQKALPEPAIDGRKTKQEENTSAIVHIDSEKLNDINQRQQDESRHLLAAERMEDRANGLSSVPYPSISEYV